MENSQDYPTSAARTGLNGNHTTVSIASWTEMSDSIPLGIFIIANEDDPIQINSTLEEILQVERSKNNWTESEFWARFGKLAGQAGRLPLIVTEAKQDLDLRPAVPLEISGGSYLIQLLPLEPEPPSGSH
jgi:hypothetical protein